MTIYINKNLSILIVRIIIGAVFVTTGWMKVSDMAHTIGYFQGMGFAPFFAYLVGYAELIGAAMIILGLYAELAALVLGIIILVAIYLSWHMGFQAYGLPLAVLAGLVSILGTGAGKYALLHAKHRN